METGGCASRRPGADAEHGATALEFALVLPLLVFLLAAIVHYGLMFSISLGLTSAAQEGARAAVAVDPEESAYESLVIARARAAVVAQLSWLSAAQQTIVLGSDGDLVSVEVETDATLGPIVRVTVEYPDYATQPLLPVFTLPILGEVPPVPARLYARAIAQL